MKKNWIVLMAVFGLVLGGCTKKEINKTADLVEEKLTVPESWIVFKNEEKGFQVSHPSTWTVEEQHTETSRGVRVYPKEGGFAYVLFHAYKDERLIEEGGMEIVVEELGKGMQNDPDVKLEGFSGKKEEGSNTGGYIATGTETRYGNEWRFEEKGIMDTYGKAVLIHSAMSPEIDEESWQVVYMIEDSFKILD